MPHTVYLLLCGSEVVYVGCTSSFDRRIKSHQDKVYTSVVKFENDNKFDALYWERKWILFFLPKYNWIPGWCFSESNLPYKIGIGQ